jgi:1,4-dihydroxy-2-naphthoate octaprenyltransferase
MIIFGLIGFSAIVGITLAIQTGWLLLVMGCACCFIGVFYTFGPIPLSRMPLGEVFSGVTMGLGIFAITVYLNTYDKKLFFMELDLQHFAITGSTTAALAVVWASIPLIATIANIMLANNLCDLEQDIENHRYTLPFYLGKKNAVILFNLLMYGSYLAIVIGLITGIYQWPILITFLSLLKVYPQTKAFTKEQIKHKTFAMSIKNLVAFNGSYALGLLVTLLWQLI